MDAREVSALYDSMRRYGIPGELVPVDASAPAGDWVVVDPVDQQDITTDVLARVAAAERQVPTRGFVVSR
ncbi:hypothetical protein GCM10022244_53120 [Streptomyces gulbargensis]|uniref:Uncharacterized protein n=1 Tax=Streptomyces gulbargensis TaxID=364901 RepID=A0ABP7N7J8_9ACTN